MLKLRLVQELRSSGYIVIKALLDNRHRCRVNRVRSYLPCVYMPYPYLKDKCEVLTTACEKLMDLLSSSPSGSLMSVEEDIMIDEGHPHYLLWLERANKNGVWGRGTPKCNKNTTYTFIRKLRGHTVYRTGLQTAFSNWGSQNTCPDKLRGIHVANLGIPNLSLSPRNSSLRILGCAKCLKI